MTANQCHRPNLGTVPIYEPFSVCSYRSNAVGHCCKTPIKGYQCWNYCAVEESQFPTWLDCVRQTINSTWDSACQRADESPVLTATTPYPASFTQPTPPSDYYSRFGSAKAVNASAIMSAPFGDNAVNSTATMHVVSLTPTATDAKRGGGVRGLEMSVGGLMCALLVVSAFAL